MAWDNTPAGRVRLWCKVCRKEGQPWLTSDPCGHILRAVPDIQIDLPTAMNTLRALMAEVDSPVSADPS